MLATQSNSATMPLVQIDYKRKYKALKKKLKLLIYEHECFLEELGKAQRKLLKVNRDKSFLLDRLLLHEKPCDSSSESDLTGSSDSEAERDSNVRKRKLMPILAGSTNVASGSNNQASKLGVKHMEPLRKKARIIRKVAKGLQLGGRTISIQGAQLPTSHTNMTREELERHLEIKQSTRQLMSLSAAPSALPDDIFCNDDSNQDNEARVRSSSNVTALTPDHDHLVIDIPSKKQ